VSRLNELVRDRRFASHVVDAWVGNSEKVRRDHYLLVTDADYQAAGSGAGEIPAHSPLISSHQESSTLYDSREKRLQSLEDAKNQQDAENQYPRQGLNNSDIIREKQGGGEGATSDPMSSMKSGQEPSQKSLRKRSRSLPPASRPYRRKQSPYCEPYLAGRPASSGWDRGRRLRPLHLPRMPTQKV
jgi:hypothetical protein